MNDAAASGGASLQRLQERLGYHFKDGAVLAQALAHASSLPRGEVRAGERLEFLGDAVLDLAIADLLMRSFGDAAEGSLSRCRAQLVCTESLAAKARQLGIGGELVLGRGEEQSGGRDKDSILAASYEAVLGAIYRDGGFQRARAVVRRHFHNDLRAVDLRETRDWKTRLQEHAQAQMKILPAYRLTAEEGPPHAKRFTCEVWLADQRLAAGSGASKREAEQRAAEAAMSVLGLV